MRIKVCEACEMFGTIGVDIWRTFVDELFLVWISLMRLLAHSVVFLLGPELEDPQGLVGWGVQREGLVKHRPILARVEYQIVHDIARYERPVLLHHFTEPVGVGDILLEERPDNLRYVLADDDTVGAATLRNGLEALQWNELAHIEYDVVVQKEEGDSGVRRCCRVHDVCGYCTERMRYVTHSGRTVSPTRFGTVSPGAETSLRIYMNAVAGCLQDTVCQRPSNMAEF